MHCICDAIIFLWTWVGGEDSAQLKHPQKNDQSLSTLALDSDYHLIDAILFMERFQGPQWQVLFILGEYHNAVEKVVTNDWQRLVTIHMRNLSCIWRKKCQTWCVYGTLVGRRGLVDADATIIWIGENCKWFRDHMSSFPLMFSVSFQHLLFWLLSCSGHLFNIWICIWKELELVHPIAAVALAILLAIGPAPWFPSPPLTKWTRDVR